MYSTSGHRRHAGTIGLCVRDDAPAVCLYRKFGFVFVGTLVRYGYRAGEFADVYAIARLHMG